MKVHVCLVSQQAAPNLLPALDSDLRPEKVILVISSKMKKQAENIHSVLRENGLRVDSRNITNEHDFSELQNNLMDLATSLEQDGFKKDEIGLNITGGTKLMSVAAQSIAEISEWRMFYVDVDTDQVIWLGKEATPPQLLKEYLRLRYYLQAYGFKLLNEPVTPSISPKQKSLISTLVIQSSNLEKPLAQLNWLTQQAEDKNSLNITMDAGRQDSRELDAVLRHFEDAGALRVTGDTIHFSNADDRDFVKGGWLEQHVFQVLASQTEKLGIRDKAINITIKDENKVESEQDIVFLAHNRLFIIECKTARMDNPKAPKANDTLFKLAENCRRIGGLGTRGMLVSYRSLRDSEKRLANALNITLVCGREIARLEEKISQWVSPSEQKLSSPPPQRENG